MNQAPPGPSPGGLLVVRRGEGKRHRHLASIGGLKRHVRRPAQGHDIVKPACERGTPWIRLILHHEETGAGAIGFPASGRQAERPAGRPSGSRSSTGCDRRPRQTWSAGGTRPRRVAAAWGSNPRESTVPAGGVCSRPARRSRRPQRATSPGGSEPGASGTDTRERIAAGGSRVAAVRLNATALTGKAWPPSGLREGLAGRGCPGELRKVRWARGGGEPGCRRGCRRCRGPGPQCDSNVQKEGRRFRHPGS